MRQYVRHLGLVDSPFLDRAVRKRTGEDGRLDTVEGYAIAAHVPEELTAPPYVSREEFKALMVAIEEDPMALNPAPIIVQLEFACGLRIGEILGMTLEDLQSEYRPGSGWDYFIVLRDRVSDRRDQHAKSLRFKPKTREDYGSPSYKARNVGYQKVHVPDDLYFAVAEYIEATRSRFPAERLLSGAAADNVGGKWSMEDNQYVFLNTKGSSLKVDLWNKRLRSYFRKAGIHVDEGRREVNLNHRLRHGFAMMLKRDLKVDDVTARTLMRHRSLRSMQPYLLPTDEDVRAMYGEVISGLKELLLGGGAAA